MEDIVVKKNNNDNISSNIDEIKLENGVLKKERLLYRLFLFSLNERFLDR